MSGCVVTVVLAGADGKVPSMPSGVRFTPSRGGMYEGRAVAAAPVLVHLDKGGRATVTLTPSSVVGDYTVRAGSTTFRIRVPDSPAAALRDLVVEDPA